MEVGEETPSLCFTPSLSRPVSDVHQSFGGLDPTCGAGTKVFFRERLEEIKSQTRGVSGSETEEVSNGVRFLGQRG